MYILFQMNSGIAGCSLRATVPGNHSTIAENGESTSHRKL